MDSAVITSTKRGKPKIFFDGYSYNLNVAKRGTFYYRCSESRSCSGNAKGTDPTHQQLIPTKEHNHERDDLKVDVAVWVSSMMIRAREECTSMPLIFETETDKLLDKGMQFSTEIESYSSLKSGLYRHRIKKFGAKLPKKAEDILLNGKWIETIGGGEFLLCDKYSFVFIKDVSAHDCICFAPDTIEDGGCGNPCGRRNIFCWSENVRASIHHSWCFPRCIRTIGYIISIILCVPSK